jgi:hypothetical protein
MASPNGLTSSTTDSMLKNLFKFAMSGQWEEVVDVKVIQIKHKRRLEFSIICLL